LQTYIKFAIANIPLDINIESSGFDQALGVFAQILIWVLRFASVAQLQMSFSKMLAVSCTTLSIASWLHPAAQHLGRLPHSCH
jgi:hypothetical protein